MSSAVLQRWNARLTAFDELTSRWKTTQLGALQRDCEHEATAVHANRESLAQQRRVVSTKTKEFAKLPTPEEKLADIVPLVKCYQSHIDDVTKSLKSAEDRYLELLATVRGLTDPYPMMEKFSREKQTILDFIRNAMEASELRAALGEREAELAELKNQEVTIAELRDQLAKSELGKAEAMQRSAADAAAGWPEILRQYQVRESAATQETKTLQMETQKWKRLQMDAAEQVVVLRAKIDELEAHREREVADLVEELDQASTQLALRDRELRRLHENLQADHAVTSQPVETPERATTRSAHLLMMEEHIDSLQRKIAELTAELSERATAWDRERDSLLATHQAEVARLQHGNTSQLSKALADLDGALHEIAAQRSRNKSLEEEVAKMHQAVRTLEAELSAAAQQQQQTHSARITSSFSLEKLLGEQPQCAADEVPHALPPQGSPTDDAFVAVASQRDKLRQRLLALEEATSVEIHRLQMELNEARLSSSSGHAFRGLSVVTTSSDSDEASTTDLLRRPLLLFQDGRIQLTQDALVEVLDRGNMLLSRLVLSNLHARRAFVGYLAVLHLYLLLAVMLNLLFG